MELGTQLLVHCDCPKNIVELRIHLHVHCVCCRILVLFVEASIASAWKFDYIPHIDTSKT